MKNIFEISYDRQTGQTYAQYDKFVIRKVTKKQEEKLNTLGQKYKVQEQNKGIPRWLNLLNRISFSATFTSFIFFIVSLFIHMRESKENFIKEYLWLIIILCVSVVIFVGSIGLAIFMKKRQKQKTSEDISKELFQMILDTSKEYLSIPTSAKSLEVLMEQDQGRKRDKIHKFSNVVLSVFKENDMLCFADLYIVIGIPINTILQFETIEEPYHFIYWHKKESDLDNEAYGVKRIRRPIRCYQANQYSVLTLKSTNEDLGIYLPVYETAELQKILNEESE